MFWVLEDSSGDKLLHKFIQRVYSIISVIVWNFFDSIVASAFGQFFDHKTKKAKSQNAGMFDPEVRSSELEDPSGHLFH